MLADTAREKKGSFRSARLTQEGQWNKVGLDILMGKNLLSFSHAHFFLLSQ